jgi:gliding motility-associated protein GldM
MAAGKLTARQKMINLLYLVFIAMLALNMSKEVLSAFGFMKEEVEESNQSTANKNELAYNGLEQKAADQPEKYVPIFRKAKEVKVLTTDFYSYLENLKSKMTADVENKKDYESMDKTDFLDNYFFKGDGKTAEGKEFVDRINNFRDQVISTLGPGYKDLESTIRDRFDTDDVKVDDIIEKVDWLKYRYEGFPLIASLTNITQLQANIKNTESDILNTLLGNQLISDSKLTGSNYKGIVSLDKTAYFSGEQVKGQVVLGRYDASLVPTKVTLNGQDITNKAQNGQVILDMPAGNVGNKTIKGEITFMQDGKPEIIPFESEYSVISQPDEAVISADKMNVVYRGLDNPISVSLPGVGDKDLQVSGAGLTKVGDGKFVMRPGTNDVVNINVTGTLGGGKTVTSKKEFRIKDIPAASGSIRGQYGTARMPKSSLVNAQIGAGLPDFVFDLTLAVTSFKVNVPGELSVVVTGDQLSAAAKKIIEKARRGDIVTFFDIEAVVTNSSSYKLKKVLPIGVEITN